MNIRNSIQDLVEEITGYRHRLHENPGIAYEEVFANGLVKEKLTEWGIPFEDGIAVTGIVATIEGEKNTSGRTLGLRADMDALPIHEDGTGKPHTSQIPGRMHGCGHDGHTAMLLGAAKYLSENRNFDGKVHLIFQPAEEGQGGAAMMIEEGLFERFPCDRIFGLHNWPRQPRGLIGTRRGAIMASADRFDITVRGKGGHAAQPHFCVDPVLVGSQIVMALQTLISRRLNPVSTGVISVTNFNCGTGAYNVIADEAKMSGTLRSFDPNVRDDLKQRIIALSADTARSYGAEALCVFAEGGYMPTVNDVEATEFCIEVARGVVGDDNVDELVEPSAGAEDFGAMLEQVPGAYVFLGQAEDDENSIYSQGLHTPRYDFNDAIIPTGIEYFVRLVEEGLPL